ncbi:DNA cytosine methyltransferase [Azotobacter sp. CWF10]
MIVAGNGQVRTRLLSIYEAAALMGLEKTYILPEIYQHAFKVIGDGVAVPPVRFLADRLLEPLAMAAREKTAIHSKKTVRTRLTDLLAACTDVRKLAVAITPTTVMLVLIGPFFLTKIAESPTFSMWSEAPSSNALMQAR